MDKSILLISDCRCIWFVKSDTIPEFSPSRTYFLIVTGCGAFPDFTGHQVTKQIPQTGAVLFCADTSVTAVLECVNGSWSDIPVCNDCTYGYFIGINNQIAYLINIY